VALAVKWSSQAIRNLDQILTYLEENWGEKVVREFVEALEKQIGLIAEYPRRLFKKVCQSLIYF
jgi:plasmid stabilization system protein ParE